MYIEDVVAGMIRAAAESGKIPGLRGDEVFTDMTGVNEWQGLSKLYVIRDRIELLADLSREYGYSGLAQSRLTLAALGVGKAAADLIIRHALRALRRHLNDPPSPLDTFALDAGDEITFDAADLPALDDAEAAVDTARIAEVDRVTIDRDDAAVFGALDAVGPVDGDGWLIVVSPTGRVAPHLVYDPAARDITDWRLAAASGVERFDAGAWREQYFQTKTLDLLHRVAVE